VTRSRKLLFGLVVAALVLAAIELGAHLFLGRPPPYDLFVRVSQCHLEVGDETVARVCPTAGREPLSIPREKTRAHRVIFFGGSSMVRPHGNAVPTWVARRLPDVEVVNLAVEGMGAANVARLVAEAEALTPDLIVLYSGHNDYNQNTFRGDIEGTRLWLLPVYGLMQESWIHAALARGTAPVAGTSQMERRAGVRALGTNDPTALERRDEVNARFQHDLRLALSQSSAPALVATLLRNPEHPPTGTLTAGHPECPGFINAFDAATRDYAEQAALAEAACGEGALTWWLRSRAFALEGREAEAAEAFDRSLHLDAIPLRAPPDADEIIRAAAADLDGVRLVELTRESELSEASWFTDPLHFSKAGSVAVAEVLAAAIADELGLEHRPR